MRSLLVLIIGMNLEKLEDIKMADLKRWTPQENRWTPKEEISPEQQSQEDIYAQSEQSPRGWKDSLRDLGYGVAKGTKGIADLLRSPLDDKFAESMAKRFGEKIPDINKEIEKIKSPNPSLGGKALQLAGEYGLPFAAAPRTSYAALRAGGTALANMMPITRGIAGAPIRRGLAAIPEGTSTPIARDVIAEARRFLNTPHAGPIRSTIEPVLARAEAGDSQAVFDLQSSLGTLAHDLTSFPSFGTERAAGRGARDLQQNILGHWYDSLREHGLGHAADNIAMGRGRYRNYQQYAKHLRNALGLYVAKELGMGGPVTNLIKKID